MEFPYLEVKKGYFGPLVPLEFFTKEGVVYESAYVDSGASVSVFRPRLARLLSLNLHKGHRTRLTIGDGNELEIFLFRLPIRFSGVRFRATIGISARLGLNFNIIGRASFFDRFRICFNDHDRLLTTLRLI